jgi:O-acetyl-ADP-ribose deacetylase (regulator of RNase III)
MALKEVRGDLIQLALGGKFEVIAHGCNCQCAMGAGIAKAIRETFPEAWEIDQATTPGDRSKLGTCTFAKVDREGRSIIVVNAYTQFSASGEGVLVDYDAVASCMRWIKELFSGKCIGLPQIGAGLAGGDWEAIEQIIAEEFANEDVTIVRYSR